MNPATDEDFVPLNDHLQRFAETTPEAVAAVCDSERLTYRELHNKVERLASALVAHGIVKGDRVATLLPPSSDFLITYLAAVSIGVIWIGLNPRYTQQELAYVLQDSTPSLLFARNRIGERAYSGDLEQLAGQAPSIKHIVMLDGGASKPTYAKDLTTFLSEGKRVRPEALQSAREICEPLDPAMIVYTSGSTGAPKGALLHQLGIVTFALRQNRIWPVSPLISLNYFPINHIGCVLDLAIPTLLAGGTSVFLEQFSPQASLQAMQDEKVTFCASVPSVFHLQLAEKNFNQFDLSAVQLIVWEGAAMPSDMIDTLLAFNVPLASNYGMTESGSAITVIAPCRDKHILETSAGWPFEGVEVRLRASDGTLTDDTGEIEARSIHNMTGYWNRPEATREALTEDGWLSTGDLGRRNTDGSYSIVGRVKEMYKSGGYNVYPREVENVLEGHPHVQLAAVVSTEDPVWQEVGIAYVVTEGTVTPADLETYCKNHLANYKRPKAFVMLDEMPILPIGKIDKVSLKAQASQDYKNISGT